MSTIVCSPCLRDDKTTECLKYCTVCDENLCRDCFREHVKTYSTSEQCHHLIGRDEMPDWLMSRQNAQESTSRCCTHPDNDLDSFCTDHDVICCGACAVTTHRLCSVVEVKDLDGQSEREGLIQKCFILDETLRALLRKRKTDQSTIRLSTAASLKTLRQFRKIFDARFDELERRMVDTIDSKCIDNDNRSQNDQTELEKLISLLATAVNESKSSEADLNNIRAFIDNSNLKGLVKTIQSKCEKVGGNDVEGVHFFPNKHLEKYIHALHDIGYCSKYPPKTQAHIERTIELKGLGDTSFDIRDIAQSDTGGLIVLDASLNRLVVLDESYTVGRTYGLVNTDGDTSIIGEPFCLCIISPYEVAVSMIRDKMIAIVDVTTEDWKQRTIEVVDYCRGVTYNDHVEELYVACGGGSLTAEGLGQVCVYNLQGDHLRTIKHSDERSTALFVRPLHLAVSNDHSKLYVLDGIKGVICVNIQGKLINKYSTSYLEDATGLCIDQNDNILVTCGKHNAIVRFMNNMGSHDLLTDQLYSELSNPQCICYDSKKSTFVVGCMDSKSLHIV